MSARRLGHYEILGPVGRGGMGRVFRARDTVLGREVALKLLPEDRVRDPRRRELLRREARLLAALAHPHIATIYALEESGEHAFLAMELIVGKTLAQVLEAGPLPARRALHLGRQIASALEAAHARRVIHRDLKPGNVLVTGGDDVKVVDFGLGADRSESDPDETTPDSRVTLSEGFLGTPGYASPEQLRHEPSDERADIWAFGVVLYECLAGRRAFPGRSGAERVAATLRSAADLGALPPGTPEEIRSLIAACLAKGADERPGSFGAVLRVVDAALAAPESGTPPSAAREPRAPSARLPLRLTPLIGRDADLAEAEALLARERLVTLTGAGGCGKTSLALEIARRASSALPDGARFAELAAVVERAGVEQAVAGALGLGEEREVPLRDTVIRALRDRELLLVLDDVDHCLHPCAELVEELLRECPPLRVLVTTREALGIPGERVQRVAPLEIPAPSVGPEPERVLRVDSCRLFAERAQAVDPEFRLTEGNAAAVARICRRLDGIPLALELAAARVRVLGAEEIAERLDDRFRLLTVGSRTALPHHRTLSALIEWSYDHLEPETQRVLRALSVFTAGWTLESAEAVAGGAEGGGGALDPLQDLVAKSLVERGDGKPGVEVRWRMLETIREFARKRLDEARETAAVRARHRRWFRDVAERAAAELTGPGQADALARLEAEHANLHAALRAAVEEAPEDALRMATALGRYWLVRGRWTEGRALGGEVLASPAARAPTARRAAVLHGVGYLTFYQGDSDGAAALFDEALAIRRTLGGEAEIADSLTGKGFVAAHRGELAEAAALFGEGLEIARRRDDRHGMARALNNLGWVERQRGEFETAQGHYEESLLFARELGDEFGIGFVLTNLGHVLEWRGDPEAAAARFVEARDLRDRLGDRAGVAESLLNLGNLSFAEGRDEEARQRLEEALSLYREIGHRSGAATVLASLGRVAAREGKREEARACLEESLRTRRELGDRQGMADSLEAWAGALLREGKAEEAARRLEEAERIREEIGTPASPREAREVAATREGIRRALGLAERSPRRP